MNYNIVQPFTAIARELPDRTGLISKISGGYKYWSFSELHHNTYRYVSLLENLGVGKGDRVILMVLPSMEFICLTFALFHIGAVVILIDPGMGYKNLTKSISSVQPDVFIGIPKAHLFRKLFSHCFSTIRLNICVGPSFGFFGHSITKHSQQVPSATYKCCTEKDDLAAIIFTTGSTGPPKGVQYTHSIFAKQLDLIREYYMIRPDDVDQPAFPLFALFSIALGACAVIPQMNPAKPAKVNPAKFIKTIFDHKVTYSFGSPAIWNVVSRYCLKKNITLPIKKVLMAGAPVSGELVSRLKKILTPEAEVYTPYGATEALPVSSITGTEIIEDTWPQTLKGKGACVGKPLPGIDIQIIKSPEAEICNWHDVALLDFYEIGEIVVKGDVVTRAYDHNEKETKASKIQDSGGLWHRMGDMGYTDTSGRLWFCGRKAHRVITPDKTMFTIPCEAIFNQHPEVFRSALVGVGAIGNQRPIIIVETQSKNTNKENLINQLRILAKNNPLTENIDIFLVHPAFPVDIRHNAKIFREKLAVWAEKQLISNA